MHAAEKSFSCSDNITMTSPAYDAVTANIFKGLLDDTELADVVLVSEVEIPCHKLVLSARSPVFKTMLAGRNKEMKEGDSNRVEMKLSSSALKKFVNFLYMRLDQIAPESVEEAVELIDAAQMYQVGTMHLKEFCEAYLTKQVKVENVPEMLSLAKRYSLVSLKSTALNMWKTHCDRILELGTFVSEIVSDVELLTEAIKFLPKSPSNTTNNMPRRRRYCNYCGGV